MKFLIHRCRLAIIADNRQFYICGSEKSGRPAPEDWTKQDVANRAKTAPGIVIICPVRNTQVPVEVGIWHSEPHMIFGTWQHIIEAPLAIDGLIEVHERNGGAHASFSVDSGDYTVRALFRGLDTLADDGLTGEDFYEIQIWKSRCSGLRVIKRWNDC